MNYNIIFYYRYILILARVKSSFHSFLYLLFILLFLQNSTKQETISEIYMEVKGEGNQKIIQTSQLPYKVLINGNISSVSSTGIYYLSSSEINYIIIQWNYTVTNCAAMFYVISNLTKIDFSKFDSSKVTNLNGMFIGCYSLTSINFENFNTSLVKSMAGIFYNCGKLISLDLKGFNTSLVSNTRQMFYGAKALKEINLNTFNTSLIEDMSYMFYGCINLKIVNINNFNTSSLRDISFMFYNCQSLESLDLNSLNTSSVTSMEHMFYNCFELSSLNINKFDTSLVTNMGYMFSGCISLKSLNLSHFNTSSVVDMCLMFENCKKLKYIELNNFVTSSVINMKNMFYNCYSLISLNLYNFNITSINSKNMTDFASNMDIKTVYCINEITGGKLISQINSSNPNFINNCSKLCLISSRKFIPEKGICDFKYEYDDKFYDSCPNNTYIKIDNNLTCYKEPDGYYLDLDDHIYKQCYPTCKKCNELGNDFDHKCLECYSNFTFIKDFNNNCYEICKYYYYFDSNNNYQCTKSNNCIQGNDKIIKEKKKCIDKCANDNDYKYEYNFECYYSCPNDTYISSDNPYKCYKNLEGYYLENNIYKKCYPSCKNCFDIGNEIDNKCTECYSNYSIINDINYYSNCYNVCEYYYYFDSYNNYYCTKSNECPDKYNKLIERKKKCTDNCSKDNIYKYEYNNKCYKSCPNNTHILLYNFNICEIKKINDYNKTELFKIFSKINNNSLSLKDKYIKNIKTELLNGNLDSLLSSSLEGERKDIIINYENIIYQITTSDNQNNYNSNYNISSIKLGECETILKNYYNISENETLLIFKIDFFEEGLLIPIIEYEIYNLKTKEQLNLNHCNDIKIDISIPVNINENTLYKYNLSSDYYNDICFISNEKKIDITLNERKKEFIKNNMSLCESNCDYMRYNLDTKNVLCKCQPKNYISLISDLSIKKNKLLNNFIDLKNSSNIYIIKCYKILFNKEGLIYNIGNYVILTIILINLVSLILFIIRGYDLSINMINTIIKNIQETRIKKENKFLNNNINNEKKNKEKTKDNNPPRKHRNIKNKVVLNVVGLNDNNYGKSNTKIELKISENINKFKKHKPNNIKNKNQNINNIINKSSQSNNIYRNDYELNNLTYKEALKYDQRTYFKYYFSLLKQKQLFIFSFYTYTDYNSKIIKICLFFFSFSLYYTINALFFTDSTMNKIYETDGAFNFIYQIPQIIYSSLISNIINILISNLALSEKRIIKLRNENNISKEKTSFIIKCFLIKYIFFFILTFLFLIIFWYYLSCFGAVYKNTQIHLIKDTLISFNLTLFYPFGLNLIPGIFRIPALNNNEKNREFLYKVSKIIQLI